MNSCSPQVEVSTAEFPCFFDTDSSLQLKTAIGDLRLETLFFDLSYADAGTTYAQLCFFTTACGHFVAFSLFFPIAKRYYINCFPYFRHQRKRALSTYEYTSVKTYRPGSYPRSPPAWLGHRPARHSILYGNRLLLSH